MNEYKKHSLVIFLLIVPFFLAFKPVGSISRKYKTRIEKERFFNKLSCDYIQGLVIDYSNIDELKKSIENLFVGNESQFLQDQKKYGKMIQNYYQVPMYIKWISDEIGYGLFAGRDIKAGEFLCEYAGVVRLPKQKGDNVDYAWYYTVSINDKCLLVDARHKGNEARFANHSQKPNCIVKEIFGFDRYFHICFFAQSQIEKDKQITISYGSGYWDSRKVNPQIADNVR